VENLKEENQLDSLNQLVENLKEKNQLDSLHFKNFHKEL